MAVSENGRQFEVTHPIQCEKIWLVVSPVAHLQFRYSHFGRIS